ncbi:YdhR family protein [Salmonella enterica subsp. enterica]|nr:YdhR family protein [Salmonella enterica subsp. enterica]
MHFNFSGLFWRGDDSATGRLAESINEEPGFIWKNLTESEKTSKLAAFLLV